MLSNKVITGFFKGSLFAAAGLVLGAPASYGSTVISYTTTITPDVAGSYAGVANTFYLPYAASNSNVTVGSTYSSGKAGSFITDTFGGSNQPAVTTSGIILTINASIGSTNFAPITFFGNITNPATNVYCLDFASTAGSSSSTNCSSANPGTSAARSFDNNQFLVEVPSLTMINAPTKTTNLAIGFAPVAAPEPASMGFMGLALFGLGALGLRRKAKGTK